MSVQPIKVGNGDYSKIFIVGGKLKTIGKGYFKGLMIYTKYIINFTKSYSLVETIAIGIYNSNKSRTSIISYKLY
jgi:hypothetical protein